MSGAETSTDPVKEALILDLLEWLAKGDRTYEEAMDAWRTSCPKLTIWEDATDRGLVAFREVNGSRFVRLSPAGLDMLGQRRRHRSLEGSEADLSAG